MDKMVFDIIFFKNGHIYMKDAECPETNEKSIFLYLQFLVSEIRANFYSKLVSFRWILSTKLTITLQQIKTGKIGKLIFHLFQLVAHISCKSYHFWTILPGVTPVNCKYNQLTKIQYNESDEQFTWVHI